MTIFRTLAAASATAILLAQTAPAFAQTAWDMATPYPEAEFHTQNIVQFAQEISDATSGGLNIMVHSGSSLFKHPEIKRSVQNQFIPIGEVLMANLFNENPIFGADNIPFIASNYDSAKALWDAQRPLVEAKLAEDGIRLLYAVPWPGQGFYTNKPLTSGSDMEGMRFRTYNATTGRMAELLGASPTTIEAVEIPQAFSTGIVDAMVTSGATGARTKAWDFTTQFYDLQAWLPKNMIIVNEAAFSALPEDQQQAILDAAATAETRGWAMSEEIAISSVAELGEHMTVNTPDAQLSADLAAVGETMALEWAESVGPDGQAVLDALK
ncbi:TRAP transporter substrate-binding protein [Tateyamaria pelophila]|uniref:TRAP transporter substrate-binding protein n=1 Tax=Tateyamaria pelophila TaxID=328415 RepID=UPI001CBFD7A4|nr:TRAP transporter substrate-binding protein [Tateyamaria pelophila]